jgi:hypothetical protein
VLQTLSILIQNLRNQQTVYYLFSNNHINEIVTMRFDFEDDEVLVRGGVVRGGVVQPGRRGSACPQQGAHAYRTARPFKAQSGLVRQCCRLPRASLCSSGRGAAPPLQPRPHPSHTHTAHPPPPPPPRCVGGNKGTR